MAARLGAASPFFIVRDVGSAMEFYERQLGFEVRFAAGEPAPFFAVIGRDQAQIMLKTVAQDVGPLPNPSRHEDALWDAFVFTESPDALATEFEAKGARLRTSVGDQSGGLRGFEVEDRDGYVLFFGCPS